MVRYPEKKYLLKYDLDIELFKLLELEVNDITPLRKVFILSTTEGKKILKRMEYSKEKIEHINWCLNALNCDNVCKLKTYSDGSVFKEWNNEYYIIMDCIEGRELNYANPIEYIGAVNVLANIHNLSNKAVVDSISRNGFDKVVDKDLLSKYNCYIKDIEEINKWVSKYKYLNEFDSLFVENVDIYISEMIEAKELLQTSNYLKVRREYDKLSICHNDLAEHNFLINKDKISLIDFDYATVDLRIIDLGDILLKGIKNAAFDIEKGVNIINEYNKVNALSEDEYKLLYTIMLFPREFYSMVKNYYHKEKEWEEEVFLNRFRNKISNDIFRRKFLEEYKKIYIK